LRFLPLALSAVMMTAMLPVAADELPRANVEKTAASGQTIVLGSLTSVKPDCTPANFGPIVVRVLKAPAHGKFSSDPAMVYPIYHSQAKQFAKCNNRRTPGLLQTYKSDPGYKGTDTIDFVTVYPNGNSQRVHIAIKVI